MQSWCYKEGEYRLIGDDDEIDDLVSRCHRMFGPRLSGAEPLARWWYARVVGINLYHLRVFDPDDETVFLLFCPMGASLP